MSSRPTRATIDERAYLDLQNLARRTQRSTQDLLHLYALEGFLARLAISPHAAKLVLKGGVLLAAYGNRRATRDIDLQGRQVANDIDTVLGLVREIISTHIDDGLAFRPDTATAAYIREDDNYHGIRVDLVAHLATARIGFHVDVNVGDPIWPPPERIIVPGILDRDVPLNGYPLPMVHAEKIVTAVDRGPTNTRWRDFADIYTLSGRHPADADQLRGSIQRVASYRRVALTPLATRLDGWADTAQPRWSTWRRKQRLSATVPAQFSDALAAVITFADPVLTGQASGATWHPGRRSWHWLA
jgi:hypothetical protein